MAFLAVLKLDACGNGWCR
jgi:hypothetical protein